MFAVLEKTVKEAVALEPKQEKKDFGPFNFKTNSVSLRDFTSKRLASVVAQLEGKSDGKAIGGFGFPGGGFPGGGKGPPMFGPGAMLAKSLLAGVDNDKNGKLSQDEFVTATERMSRFLRRGGPDGPDTMPMRERMRERMRDRRPQPNESDSPKK